MLCDCGVAFTGTSLNHQLLQGLNLTSALLGVFLRVRKEPVAVMGNIESLFHQVNMTEEDREFLCFFVARGRSDQGSG